MCLPKITSLPFKMKSWARCLGFELGGCIFSCSKGNCIFFSSSFLIFWNSINLTYVSQLRDKDFVSDYLFTSQRESHSVPDMDFFAIPLLILSHLELLRIDLRKLTSSILMEIVTSPVALVAWWILFLYAPPHKGLAFWKNYLWASLSLHFHIVLKSLVSY